MVSLFCIMHDDVFFNTLYIQICTLDNVMYRFTFVRDVIQYEYKHGAYLRRLCIFKSCRPSRQMVQTQLSGSIGRNA